MISISDLQQPAVASPPTILMVIPFRGKNMYRKKNLDIVLQWLNVVKKYALDNYRVTIDLSVVEQDHQSCFETSKYDFVNHLFLINQGTFNKGWSFNVVVNQNPNYQYYGFCDADIIIYDIEAMVDQLVQMTFIEPQKTFRLFTQRLDLTINDMMTITSFETLCQQLPAILPNLSKHQGLGFASNMIFVNKQTFEQIGGWDEIFRGWGRYDDFFAYKLSIISQVKPICCPLDAVHLWHPVTLEFSLAFSPDNVENYNKLIQLDKNDLINLINKNRLTNGNPNLYNKGASK